MPRAELQVVTLVSVQKGIVYFPIADMYTRHRQLAALSGGQILLSLDVASLQNSPFVWILAGRWLWPQEGVDTCGVPVERKGLC